MRVARYWGHHLLASSPTSKEGVAALFVHSSISPHPPSLWVHIPGRLISTQLSLHADPLMPLVTVASFYGPHTAKECAPCTQHLDKILKECSIILGDNYNCVTQASHTTTLRPNLWPWLVAKERSGALSNLVAPHTPSIPFTKVRRYGGTKSYID